MSFRGRGRGRGSNFGRFAKEEKFEVFPEITELPGANLEQKEKLEELVKWGDNLRRAWNSSPYFLVDTSEGGKNKGSVTKRPPLSEYMTLTSDFVPAELAAKRVVKPSKKPKWDLQSVDLDKLDAFEGMEKRAEAQEEKKEDEEEDEDNENVEEEEVESDDDYGQGETYDDDEDDYNANEDVGDDEGCY